MMVFLFLFLSPLLLSFLRQGAEVLGPALVCFSPAVIKRKQKQLGEESLGFFSLYFPILKGSQGRKSRQQHGGRTGRRDCGNVLLTGLFSTWLRNHLPRCPTSSLSPPTSIISEENIPTDLRRGSSEGSIFSTEVPFSQVTLACINILPTFVVSSKEQNKERSLPSFPKEVCAWKTFSREL